MAFVVAIFVVVRRFREVTASWISARWLEHHSAPVRVATWAVRACGTYLVGFFTLVAVLLLFQAIGHFL